MAINKIPAPVLDTRNGDQVVAAAIGALPNELSDRSDANPAVVILEATGSIFDKLLFQLNQWPQAVIQKALSLVGVNLNAAQPGIVTQTFTLSAPQPNDSVIPKGTAVSTSDGTVVYNTTADLTIRAYSSPAGTISTTSGSTTVAGLGTTFTSSLAVGYQISTDKNTWYTVANVISDVSLTLSSSASSTVASAAYYGGAVTGTVSAQATTAGAASNVAANALNTLQSSPSGVASTTNGAAASGGGDQETTTNAIARAPQAFASRDVACTAADYAYFAQQILGTGGRSIAQANMNVTSATPGYVTVAGLSPSWTTSSSVSAQERANFIRDLASRSFAGATTVDVAANVQLFTSAGAIPAVAFYRKAAYDAVSSQIAVASALNTYLSPNTYPWGRTVYMGDLAGIVEALIQIDRVLVVNGVVACGMNWQTTANSVVFTNSSATATANAGDIAAGKITINQTFLIDPNANATQPYLVTNISGTTLTLDHAFTGASITATTNYFNSADTALANWYSLPFANLSTVTTAPPASMLVVGSV